MHITCNIAGVLYFTLYFDLVYMGLSYPRIPFFNLKEFPSYDHRTVGSNWETKNLKVPKSDFLFPVDMDYINIFIIFCHLCLNQVQETRNKQ